MKFIVYSREFIWGVISYDYDQCRNTKIGKVSKKKTTKMQRHYKDHVNKESLKIQDILTGGLLEADQGFNQD